MQVLTEAVAEPSVANANAGDRFQFEREGYFVRDYLLGPEARPVFNLAVTLRDSWAKLESKPNS